MQSTTRCIYNEGFSSYTSSCILVKIDRSGTVIYPKILKRQVASCRCIIFDTLQNNARLGLFTFSLEPCKSLCRALFLRYTTVSHDLFYQFIIGCRTFCNAIGSEYSQVTKLIHWNTQIPWFKVHVDNIEPIEYTTQNAFKNFK